MPETKCMYIIKQIFEEIKQLKDKRHTYLCLTTKLIGSRSFCIGKTYLLGKMRRHANGQI